MSEMTASNEKCGMTVSWHIFRTNNNNAETAMTNVVFEMLREQGFDVKDIEVKKNEINSNATHE